jgi:hypothetical protein
MLIRRPNLCWPDLTDGWLIIAQLDIIWRLTIARWSDKVLIVYGLRKQFCDISVADGM